MKAMKGMNLNRMLGSMKRRRELEPTSPDSEKHNMANNIPSGCNIGRFSRALRLGTRYSRGECDSKCGKYAEILSPTTDWLRWDNSGCLLSLAVQKVQ
jgi:hypothetical protein